MKFASIDLKKIGKLGKLGGEGGEEEECVLQRL